MLHSAVKPYIEDRKGKRIEFDQFSGEIQQEMSQAPRRLCPACIGDTKALRDCNRAHYVKVDAARKVKGASILWPSLLVTLRLI